MPAATQISELGLCDKPINKRASDKPLKKMNQLGLAQLDGGSSDFGILQLTLMKP